MRGSVDLEMALEKLKTIRLTGGIFGKTTLLLMVLCICVSAVAVKIGTWWFGLIIMLCLMAIVVYALKRSFDFATENPQAAIMEGAEFLSHERIIQGTKDRRIVSPGELAYDHPPPTILEAEVLAADPPPTPELERDPTLTTEEKGQ